MQMLVLSIFTAAIFAFLKSVLLHLATTGSNCGFMLKALGISSIVVSTGGWIAFGIGKSNTSSLILYGNAMFIIALISIYWKKGKLLN